MVWLLRECILLILLFYLNSRTKSPQPCNCTPKLSSTTNANQPSSSNRNGKLLKSPSTTPANSKFPWLTAMIYGKEFEVSALSLVALKLKRLVSWKDLMACKPESIDTVAHESFTKEALLGIKSDAVSQQDSLSLTLQLTGTGNLSLSWKLKQSSFAVKHREFLLLSSFLFF